MMFIMHYYCCTLFTENKHVNVFLGFVWCFGVYYRCCAFIVFIVHWSRIVIDSRPDVQPLCAIKPRVTS